MSRYDKLKRVSKRVSNTNTQQADTSGSTSYDNKKWDAVEYNQKKLHKSWDDRYRKDIRVSEPRTDYVGAGTWAEDHVNDNRVNRVRSQKKWVKKKSD